MFARINGKNVTLLQYYRKYMKVGDTVYINTINLGTRDNNTLKYLIEVGCLVPIESTVRKCVVPCAVNDFMTGKSVFPQMTYTKVQ